MKNAPVVKDYVFFLPIFFLLMIIIHREYQPTSKGESIWETYDLGYLDDFRK